jgi:large subunit ribosomal protein L17
MRHGDKINNLGRTYAHRKAMLANMASSLILHKRIQTTLAKAKELRKFVEPLATKSKSDTTHSRRIVFAELRDKYAVTELFREIAPKIADRPGGYTRILKLGTRQGDGAEQALIEFVDFNEFGYTQTKEAGGRRRRRGKGGTGTTQPKAVTSPTEAAPIVIVAPESAGIVDHLTVSQIEEEVLATGVPATGVPAMEVPATTESESLEATTVEVVTEVAVPEVVAEAEHPIAEGVVEQATEPATEAKADEEPAS